MFSILDQTMKTISFEFRYKLQREFYSIKAKTFFSSTVEDGKEIILPGVSRDLGVCCPNECLWNSRGSHRGGTEELR